MRDRPGQYQLPKKSIIFTWLSLGVIIFIGVCIAQHFRDKKLYQYSQTHYLKKDCLETNKAVDVLLNSQRIHDFASFIPRAKETQSECRFLQDSIEFQEKHKYELALSNYVSFAQRYPNSKLLDVIREHIQALFEKKLPEEIATEQVCTQLEPLTTLNLIPTHISKVSQIYLNCGNIFEQLNKLPLAIKVYEQANKAFNSPQIKQALAQAKVSEFKQNGTNRLTQPQLLGPTEDGSTVVEIKNSGPKWMYLLFSGPTPTDGSIPPCLECQVFNPPPPQNCPDKGPSVGYFLKPGIYDLAVKPQVNTLGWHGQWQIKQGQRYSYCFFLVKQPNTNRNSGWHISPK